MRISLYAICAIGIFLNVAVFWKRKVRSKRQSQTTRISLQLLCFMAAADTISLAALLLLLCTQYLGIKGDTLMSVICKVDLFLIHSASAFSIWCWLVLSAVRYIAIFRPYSHLKLNREPVIAVVVIASMCCFLESWILYGAGFMSPQCMTLESNISDEWASRLHLFEIIWSYFVPFVVITVLDIRVLCFHSRWYESLDFPIGTSTISASNNTTQSNSRRYVKQFSFTGSELDCMLEHKNSSTYNGKTSPPATYDRPVIELPTIMEAKKFAEKEAVYKNPLWRLFHIIQAAQPGLRKMKPKRSKRRVQQIRILRRCLCITLLDLSMNLPNYLFRLYLNLLTLEEFQVFEQNYRVIFNFVEDTSQLLYFAQFSLNALYLVYLVYDSPRKRSTTSTAYNVSLYRQPSRITE
uniref:G-protein coupled receptors family 1 profile domain-containing protein n=1 Tax=Acrobeloides nanus TaxID=290746 RepID=A0A914DX96_9BILA